MDPIAIFLDSDVIVAALLSEKGASSEIIRNSAFKKFVSKTITKEVDEVAKRLHIDTPDKKLFETIHVITLDIKRERLAKKYFAYVSDLEDSHVVAGAERSKSSFLLTHNLKHYNTDLIEQKLKIVVLNPGQFLQYLRSKFLPLGPTLLTAGNKRAPLPVPISNTLDSNGMLANLTACLPK